MDDIYNALDNLKDQHRRIVSQMTQNQVRVQHIARSAWRIQEEERRRLARELHDGIGQNLTALKNLLTRLVDARHDDARAGISDALEICSECLRDTRQMSRLLRPPVLDDLGLGPAIKSLARAVQAAGNLEVDVLEEGDVESLSQDMTTLAYRLVQEALNNAAKHAPGSSVLVRLAVTDDAVRISVVDDGPGFDPEAHRRGGDGFGLHAMCERAALFGGQCEIHSAPGEGTHIRTQVPIHRELSTISKTSPTLPSIHNRETP